MSETIEAYPDVRVGPFVPTDEYERWREQSAVKRVRLASGQETWLVLRQKEGQEVLDKIDSLTSNALAPGFPLFRAGKPAGTPTNMLPRMDPPLHAQVRRQFAQFFTAKRINGWKPEIQRITDTAIDDMLAAGSPADLYHQFGLVVPSRVICMLVGVDYSYAPDFDRFAEANNSSTVTAEERDSTVRELYGVVEDIFEQHRKSPRPGITGELLRMVEEGKMSYEVAVGNTVVLVVGGHETTAHSITLGALQLMQSPRLIERITRTPDRIPTLVEEMLRTQSIIGQVIGRAVTKDIEIDGEVIPAGDGLAVVPQAANLDPRAYLDPLKIDLDRDITPGHLAFGSGIHACLGQSLARAELQTVFSTLFQRIPTLRLAEGDTPRFRRDPWIYGVHRLPVEW